MACTKGVEHNECVEDEEIEKCGWRMDNVEHSFILPYILLMDFSHHEGKMPITISELTPFFP